LNDSKCGEGIKRQLQEYRLAIRGQLERELDLMKEIPTEISGSPGFNVKI